MVIVERGEAERLRKAKGWVLLYGRRKTGKTFLVQRSLPHDAYFFVKRDKGVLEGSRELSQEAFLEALPRDLAAGKTVVVDEFHRLGPDFLDRLHALGGKGRLILVSSTLHLSRSLFSPSSPLLGLVAEMPLGLIRLEDALRAVPRMGKKEMAELAVLFREPLAAAAAGGEEPRELLVELLSSSLRTIPALVGEVFTEEERSLSGIYEGILRAIASGKVVSSEIASSLFAKKAIAKDDPSLVQQYLKNLLAFGVIKRVRVLGKNRFVYKHTSPLVRFFYYADERYGIAERQPSVAELRRIADELMPRIVEDEVRAFLAERLGLEEAVVEAGDFEADAALLKFKRVEVAVEVKWRDRVTEKEAEAIAARLDRLHPREKLLVVPDSSKVRSSALRVVDLFDVLRWPTPRAGKG